MGELRWITVDEERRKASLFEPVVEHRIGRGAYRGLEFMHVRARTIINRVADRGVLPFGYTINAYRGCSHACTYCFARPTHEYLGLGIGKDFDSKIVVKINAPELVRYETAPARWAGYPIAMGTNTDPYQAAEGKYRLTRRIIQVLADRGNAFSILTKSPLVLRDLDLLSRAAESAQVQVDFSIGTLDQEAWKRSEPGTSHPQRRLDAVKRLNQAGIPSGVLMMPILPGISDHPDQIKRLVRGAAEAGARFITGGYLHLRPPLRDHMLSWVEREYPHRARYYRYTYGTRSYATAAMRKRLGGLINRSKQAAYATDGPAPAPNPRRT